MPSARPLVGHWMDHVPAPSDALPAIVPVLGPWYWTLTLVTPTLSDASPETVTVPPTVVFADGAVMCTVGAVVSAADGTFTVVDVVDVQFVVPRRPVTAYVLVCPAAGAGSVHVEEVLTAEQVMAAVAAGVRVTLYDVGTSPVAGGVTLSATEDELTPDVVTVGVPSVAARPVAVAAEEETVK